MAVRVQLADDIAAGHVIHVGHDDCGTLSRESVCETPPDTGSSARDDHDLVVEAKHSISNG
jgi:hypothetical protein